MAFANFDKVGIKIKKKETRIISDKVAVTTQKQDIIFYKNGEEFAYPDVSYTLIFEKDKDDWWITHFHESTQIPSTLTEEE